MGPLPFGFIHLMRYSLVVCVALSIHKRKRTGGIFRLMKVYTVRQNRLGKLSGNKHKKYVLKGAWGGKKGRGKRKPYIYLPHPTANLSK
jgi:hypothetical protein